MSVGRLTALVARTNVLCLPLLAPSDDSGGHAMGQDEAGTSSQDPRCGGRKQSCMEHTWKASRRRCGYDPSFPWTLYFRNDH